MRARFVGWGYVQQLTTRPNHQKPKRHARVWEGEPLETDYVSTYNLARTELAEELLRIFKEFGRQDYYPKIALVSTLLA